MEFLDAYRRPMLSISYPMLPNITARCGDTQFRFLEGRLNEEQRLVSAPYNLFTAKEKFHASHLARHGHCGSPWRTNLTPTSGLCNVQLVGEFEAVVMDRMRQAYGNVAEIDLEDAEQPVLLYTVECYYNMDLAVHWLIGTESESLLLGEGSARSQAMRWLARYLPVLEVRRFYSKFRGEWRVLYTQVHDLQAIMCGGGSPLDPRFRLAQLDERWATQVLAWFGREEFRLNCDPSLSARNEHQFRCLARATGLPVDQQGLSCVEYFNRDLERAARAIPYINRGVQALRADIDLIRWQSVDQPAILGTLVERIIALEAAGEEKNEIIAYLLSKLPATTDANTIGFLTTLYE
jgi:hypothetical protein